MSSGSEHQTCVAKLRDHQLLAEFYEGAALGRKCAFISFVEIGVLRHGLEGNEYLAFGVDLMKLADDPERMLELGRTLVVFDGKMACRA